MVYVELPEIGKELAKGDAFGVVESVKVGLLPFAASSENVHAGVCVCVCVCVCVECVNVYMCMNGECL